MKKLIITLLGILAGMLSFAQEAQDISRKFDGLYGAVDLGYQNFFSGALINDIDVIGYENQLVIDLKVGFRKQLLHNRLMLGLEIGRGFTGASFSESYSDGSQEIPITYQTKGQGQFGLNLGFCFGKYRDWVTYLYGHSTRRVFDIQFAEESGTTHTQSDENVFLRYGIGLEKQVVDRINLRASIGQVYVDYGDANTTKDPTDQFDMSLGMVYQF